MDDVFKPAIFKEEYLESIVNLDKEWESENKEIKKFKDELYKQLRDNLFCPYCRRELQRSKYDELDHIIYKSDYSNFTYQPNNIVIACKRCNNKKLQSNVLKEEYIEKVKILEWNKYPCNKEYYSIIHPYFDIYSEHIEIENNVFYMPKDKEKGINTIRMMKLNSFDLLEIRAKEAGAAKSFISISQLISNPNKDKASIIWAMFMLKSAFFRKHIFDILIGFEKNKEKCMKLDMQKYILFKKVIQKDNEKYPYEFEVNLRSNLGFVSKINSLDDETTIEAIEQFEKFYALKDIDENFHYVLYLAILLLIKQKEGRYCKAKIIKYLAS